MIFSMKRKGRLKLVNEGLNNLALSLALPVIWAIIKQPPRKPGGGDSGGFCGGAASSVSFMEICFFVCVCFVFSDSL